jgi:hypothetical protein
MIILVTPNPIELEIAALPNPSRDHFSVRINSNRQGTILVELFNSIGSTVQAFNRVMPGENIQFGQSLIPGVYYLKATQDGLTKIIKIIKM